MTFTHPGGGAAQPSDLPILPRRWGWHAKTGQLCVVMPAIDYTNANCVGREDLYISDRISPEQQQQAHVLCSTCPVLKQCLGWALAHEEFGYWAGTTAEQRTEQRKALGLRIIEPVNAHTYGLNDDTINPIIPERCNKGHYLKPRFDAAISKSPVNTPHRTDFTVRCTQCHWENNESPEAREQMRIKGYAAVAALKKRGTRNTGKRNKWGGAVA